MSKAAPDDPEHRLSAAIAGMLERILLEPCWFTAIERAARAQGATEEERKQRTMRWQERLKKRGVKPAHLDWYAYQRPVFTQFELKYGDNKPSDGQKVTMRLLTERQIPTACCWTPMEVYQHLRDAGFRLTPNAEFVARDTELRWRAADEAARGAVALVKPSRARTSKPRVRASAAAIKRGHAWTAVRP